MTLNRLALILVAAAAAAGTVPLASAQTLASGSCIVAGRLGAEGGWAPRLPDVELLGADGRVMAANTRQALFDVRQVRLSAPALLSRCDGDAPIAAGPEQPSAKGAVPALGVGVHPVEAVYFPKLRRTGELVELRVRAAPQHVTMITR